MIWINTCTIIVAVESLCTCLDQMLEIAIETPHVRLRPLLWCCFCGIVMQLEVSGVFNMVTVIGTQMWYVLGAEGCKRLFFPVLAC